MEAGTRSACIMSDMHEFGMNSIASGSIASDYAIVASLADAAKTGTPGTTARRPNAFAPVVAAMHASGCGAGPGSSKGSIQSRSLTFKVGGADRSGGMSCNESETLNSEV